MILEFLNELTQAGHRIFSVVEAKEIAERMGIKPSSVTYVLRSLASHGLIHQIYKGNYVIEDNILTGSPLHKFEIAMHLAKDGAIGCWTAMSYHELTDQVLSRVYVLAPYTDEKKRSLYQYHIESYDFLLIQVQKDHFWGTEQQFVGGVKIRITDLERTLIDGLMRPTYCGGFREVLNAFSIAKDRLDIHKLIAYGKRSPTALQKRLGWVLSHLSIENVADFLNVPETKHFDKLDPSGPRRGRQNKQWMILENI
ncbi:MAG: MarR family transcriptional regulator [Alphaproteobacteria bacterium]|nr:MarR family transcriptional regulator [Alphaproteobacteria bacterium]